MSDSVSGLGDVVIKVSVKRPGGAWFAWVQKTGHSTATPPRLGKIQKFDSPMSKSRGTLDCGDSCLRVFRGRWRCCQGRTLGLVGICRH